MFNAMLTQIVDALQDSGHFARVDVWTEDDEMTTHPKRLPGAYVVMAGAQFQGPRTMPPAAANVTTEWVVMICLPAVWAANAKQESGLDLVSAVVAPTAEGGLTGLRMTQGGMLWPQSAELVQSTGGLLVYRVGFVVEAL